MFFILFFLKDLYIGNIGILHSRTARAQCTLCKNRHFLKTTSLYTSEMSVLLSLHGLASSYVSDRSHVYTTSHTLKPTNSALLPVPKYRLQEVESTVLLCSNCRIHCRKTLDISSVSEFKSHLFFLCYDSVAILSWCVVFIINLLFVFLFYCYPVKLPKHETNRF